jgi:DNA-directed RNA polymerase subunit L
MGRRRKPTEDTLPIPSFVLESCKTSKQFSMEVRDCDVALMIALRRTILADVKTVAAAFDAYDVAGQDITVHDNTGCLHNEWLCHRLSLVPIHFDKMEIADFDPSKYEFRLNAIADGTRDVDVTTKDIHVLHNGKRDVKLEKRLFVADPITKDHIWLTRLRWSADSASEHIHLTFTARVGTGREHARWSPVSLCAYHMLIDDDEVSQTRRSIVTEHGETSHVVKNFDTLGYQRCFVKNQYGDATHFRFRIESECGLSGHDILDEAFSVLQQQIGKLQPTFAAPDPDCGHAVATFDRDNHTLAALIQAIGYELFVRNNRDPRITMIGYHQPHPLQSIVNVTFQHNFGDDHAAAFALIVSEVAEWINSAYASFRSK